MLKAYGIYKKCIVAMCKGIDVAAIMLTLSMVGVVFYQVIMRQIFQMPPIWGEEISVTFMVWFVFLGIVLGIEEDLHIGITMFVSKLPPKARFVAEVFVNALILLLAILLIVFGSILASRMFGFGTALPATGLPVAIRDVIVPIAGALMALVILGKIAEQIINRNEVPE
ncbi:MAG: TRAP transporter small permease [Clostridiales bacterium]|nr:TRAP transporter small permease [Clostridiales bacterium]